MATKFFLHDPLSHVVEVPAEQGVFAPFFKQLNLTQGTSKKSLNTNTVAGPTAGVQLASSGSAVLWTSAPLAAVTVSGTIVYNFWGLENSMSANAGWDVLVERADYAGNSISQISRKEAGVELGTSAVVTNFSDTAPTSTSLLDGDRIKVTIFGNDAGGNMASGFSFTFDFDGPTGVDGDSYVQFTEAITTINYPPRYYTSTRSDVHNQAHNW